MPVLLSHDIAEPYTTYNREGYKASQCRFVPRQVPLCVSFTYEVQLRNRICIRFRKKRFLSRWTVLVGSLERSYGGGEGSRLADKRRRDFSLPHQTKNKKKKRRTGKRRGRVPCLHLRPTGFSFSTKVQTPSSWTGTGLQRRPMSPSLA